MKRIKRWLKNILYTFGNTQGLKPGYDYDYGGYGPTKILIDRIKYWLWRKIK